MQIADDGRERQSTLLIWQKMMVHWEGYYGGNWRCWLDVKLSIFNDIVGMSWEERERENIMEFSTALRDEDI